jgi:hypothetical protein
VVVVWRRHCATVSATPHRCALADSVVGRWRKIARLAMPVSGGFRRWGWEGLLSRDDSSLIALSSSTPEPGKDTPSSKKTRPGVIAVASVVSTVVVVALAAVVLLFRKIKHHSPKAPVVTDCFTKEDGHGLGLEAQEVCSMYSGYTSQSQVYKLI